MALTEKLTAVADAIRGKTGKTEEMTLDQMATEIAGIETGGGDDIYKQLVQGTMTVFSSNASSLVNVIISLGFSWFL